jgi:hypothetical protein
MANQRTRDYADTQEVYAEDLYFSVDAASYGSGRKKKMKSQVISPLTKTGHLTESTGALNKASTNVRINVGGNELFTLLKYITPDIIDFTAATIFNATYTNYIHFYVGGPVAANFVISADNFATALFARPAFLARALALGIISGLTDLTMGAIALDDEFRIYDKSATADRKITYQVLLYDMVGEDTFKDGATNANTEAIMLAKLQETVVDQALTTSGTTYGYISMCKIGKSVTGTVVIAHTTTEATEKIAEYSIPSDWRANKCGRTTCNLIYRNDVGGADNILYIQDGTIILNTNTLSSPFAHNAFSFGWMTE